MSRFLLISIMAFLLIATKCGEEPVPTSNNNNGSASNEPLRTVKVTAKHYFQIQPTRKDSVVPGVEVKLFISEVDRAQNYNADGIQTTDSTGVAVFKGRDDSLYYVRAAHPKLGVEEDEVSTPPGTVSLMEIWYQ